MANTEFMLKDSAESCSDHPTLPVKNRTGIFYCFNCVIVGNQTPAYNLACRMLNDRFLAEDAVQESFTSAYHSFGQFHGDNLRAWFMRIVANNCRDMLRASRSRPSVPLDPVATDPESGDSAISAASVPSSLESPEDFSERAELRRTIEAGLSSLPEERRLALILVDMQGFSYEETASILNCSLGTVKSRISRGRRALRDFLRSTGELLPSRFRQEE